MKSLLNNLFRYKPTEQEAQITELVDKLLSDSNTVAKMAPLTRKIFLTNEKIHYNVMLHGNYIQATNTKFSFTKPLHPKVFEGIMDKVFDHIEKDRGELEQRIFQNEKEMINSGIVALA